MERNKIDQIYEIDRKINQIYEIWSAAHGLTLYEMQIYYILIKEKKGAITQKDFCMALDAPKTSINSIIKKQLQTGYIRMEVNPVNKREKMISFTESGQEFAKKLILPLLQYEEEAIDMLDDAELEVAIAVQTRFADILLEKVKKNAPKINKNKGEK